MKFQPTAVYSTAPATNYVKWLAKPVQILISRPYKIIPPFRFLTGIQDSYLKNKTYELFLV